MYAQTVAHPILFCVQLTACDNTIVFVHSNRTVNYSLRAWIILYIATNLELHTKSGYATVDKWFVTIIQGCSNHLATDWSLSVSMISIITHN